MLKGILIGIFGTLFVEMASVVVCVVVILHNQRKGKQK